MYIKKVLIRMFRAAILDANLYEEVKLDKTANYQAFFIIILVSLTTSVSVGIAGIFQWAGVWFFWLFLAGLVSFIAWWLILSFLTYVVSTRLSNGKQTPVTFQTVLRTIGFSSSPLLLGFFLFIPMMGIYLWIGGIIWAFIAEIIAVKQVVGFGTTRTVINCLAGWVVCLLVGILICIVMSLIFIDGNYMVFGRFNSQVNSTVRPYKFSITAWEIKVIPHELSQWMRGNDKTISSTGDLVVEYFSNSEERSETLENTVELILKKQVEEVLNEQGVSGFPPVNLKLDTTPNLLVVSPRDRIESVREIMLDNDLMTQEMEDIESGIDRLGVSSLVVKIGGFGGTYPSFVANDSSLRHTVNTVVEEWVHQYLFFRPLGFRYVLDLLGLARDYEIATMNETIAGIVSDEITTIILDRYYPEHKEPEKQPSDFDLEMREIRLMVDDYLAKDQIEQAEEYMEEKRQKLVSIGYYVRKLNQAYFAWYGTYADEPASVSPIGVELRQLRDQYDSVKEFLDVVSEMTNREDLKEIVESIK